MNIRAATPADAAWFVEHMARILDEPERTAPHAPDEVRTLEDTIARLAVPFALLAEQGGEMLGSISIRRDSPLRSRQHAGLLGMSVRRESRGQGIGRALLTAAIDHAARDGITRIELHVFAHNARAIALYEKLGFAHEGRRRHSVCFAGEYLDDLIMAKLL